MNLLDKFFVRKLDKKSTQSFQTVCSGFPEVEEDYFDEVMNYHDAVDADNEDFYKKDNMSKWNYWDDELKVFFIKDVSIIESVASKKNAAYIKDITDTEKEMYETSISSGKKLWWNKICDKYILVLPVEEDLKYDKEVDISKYYGLLMPKKLAKTKDIDRAMERAKEKKYEVKALAGVGETAETDEDSGVFKFSTEDLARIEDMERRQGFDFDTTSLKKMMGLQYFTPYQLYILENWGDFDDFYLTATRRAGKSYFFVYLAIRQLFLKHQTVLYVVPTEDAFEQPMMYIHRFLNILQKYDKNIKIKAKGEVYNSETQSVLWFKSAASRLGVRSKEATLGIIDEASFVPEDEASSLDTMLAQVRSMRDLAGGRKEDGDMNSVSGKLMCGTTINPDMPKNWYYDAVRGAENGTNPDGISIRAGIYQCPFYTTKQREKIIAKLSSNPDRLKCELLAEFPSALEKYSMNEITIQNQLTESSEDIIDAISGTTIRMFPPKKAITNLKEFDVYCSIGYDPAKKSSNSGVVITEIYVPRHGESIGFSTAKVVPVGEVLIPKQIAFTIQVEVMASLKTMMEKIYGSDRVFLGVDSTGIGEVVSEMLRNKGVEHNKIQYVSAGAGYSTDGQRGVESQKFYHQRNGIYYVKKPFLMDMPISLSAAGRFRLYRLPKVYSDFETYNDIKNFDSKKHTVDFYHAACISIFTAILSKPKVYFYNQESAERDNQRQVMSEMEKYVSQLNMTGFANPLSPKKKGDRFTKFGY